MPTPTYTPLATVTLGSSASSVTFSSIPATYRDLILVMNGSSGSGFGSVLMRFNSDSGSNYNHVLMYGYGSGSFGSEQVSNQTSNQIGVATDTISTFVVQILDSSATDKHKSWLAREGFDVGNTIATAGRWANTNAITSIQVFNRTFAVGHTFSLYGISA